MLFIAFLTLLLSLALVGLGAFLGRVLEPILALDMRLETTFGELGLIGIAGVTILGAALNWLAPLNAFVAVATIALGLAAAIVFRLRLRDSFFYGAQPLTLGFFLAALLLYVSSQAYWNNFSNHDSGLYHLQTIMLESSSPLTLGAANLHYRFGYNSLWLNDASMLMLPGLGLKTAALINGVLTVIGAGAMAQRLLEDVRRGQPMMVVIFAAMILILMIVPLSGDRNLGSPSTDWPSSLLTLYIYSAAFRLIVGAQQADGRRKLDLFLMFVASALAVTFKLSQAPVALALGLTALFCYVEDDAVYRGIIAGAIAAAVVIILWALRGIGLSGCLVYPISRTCFPVFSWTVPAHLANFDAASIQSWARLPWASPSIVLASWDWLPAWWSRVSHGTFIPLIGGFYVISALCILVRYFPRSGLCLGVETLDAPRGWTVIGLQASTIIGIAYWFFTAPDLRFGYGFLIAQPAMLLALMFPVKRFSKDDTSWPPISSVAAVRTVTGLVLVASLINILVLGRQSLLAVDRPSLKTVQVISHRSQSGFAYTTPVGGDQCWGTPLYCAIEREDTLAFRHFGIWPMFTLERTDRGLKPTIAY